jgi:serine/threonine-protein kinase
MVGGAGAGIAGQGSPRSLVWVDRTGHEESIKAPVRSYFVPRLSPDGTQVALDIRDREHDIWTWDFSHETLTRITKDPADDILPVWTTDGRRILFGSARNGVANLYAQAADGTGPVERLSTSPNVQIPLSVIPDGTAVVVRDAQPSGLSPGMGLLHLDGASAGPGASTHAIEPLIHSAFREDNGVISPDGHWIAYESDESGQLQIYARPFPHVNDGLKQISNSGGSAPLWAPNGRELFYLDGGGAHLMVVAVTTSTSLTYGTPTKLFDVPYLTSNIRTYDVSRDGQKFLFIKDASSSDQRSAPSSTLVVVLNWFEELRARVPTK